MRSHSFVPVLGKSEASAVCSGYGRLIELQKGRLRARRRRRRRRRSGMMPTNTRAARRERKHPHRPPIHSQRLISSGLSFDTRAANSPPKQCRTGKARAKGERRKEETERRVSGRTKAGISLPRTRHLAIRIRSNDRPAVDETKGWRLLGVKSRWESRHPLTHAFLKSSEVCTLEAGPRFHFAFN